MDPYMRVYDSDDSYDSLRVDVSASLLLQMIDFFIFYLWMFMYLGLAICFANRVTN
jgi:hypothetical protein